MSAPPPADPPAAKSRPRRRVLLLLLLVSVASGAIAGWRWWTRVRIPDPPAVPAAGATPEAAKALTAARQKVAETPRSADAWGQLGLVFTAHGFDEQAADCFRTAQLLDNADPRWPYLLALYYLADERDPAAALQCLEAAHACPHGDARKADAVRLRLAEAYLAQGRPDDAERLFRSQISRDPRDPRAAVGLGVTLLTRGQAGDAVDWLEKAVNSPFTRRRAAANLGVAARQLGRHDDAARYDRQTATLPEDVPPPDPFADEVAALRTGGRGGFDEVAWLEKEGRVADTIPILARMAADPTDARAAMVLGQNLSLLGDFAAAEPYARAACARDPENAQAAFLHGAVLFDLARTNSGAPKERLLRESVAASTRAVKLNPGLGLAHLSLGAALREGGDAGAALPHFRAAAECKPEVPKVQLALLQSLVENGLLDEARLRVPVAAKVVPQNNPVLAQLKKQLESKGAPTAP